MAAKLGIGFGPGTTAEAKARAFTGYLEEIGLPVEQVIGNLGPAEVGDVVSFFYAGMPDRFKVPATSGGVPMTDSEVVPLPAEQWCATLWEADEEPGRAA